MANFLDEMYGSTPRNRAGQRVTGGMLPGALAGLRDMLSGVARGSVSATLGAPADILNMTKAAQAWLSGRTNNENTDIPYGSEYFKGVLPMRPTTQTGKVAQTLGEFVPTPIPARALTEAARASAPYAARHAVNLAEKYGVSPTMNVVKPKGGNWLAGAVEDDLKPMKSYVPSEESLLRAEAVTPVGAAEARARSIPDAAINKWIDKKLNPYIKNEMGTPEDPVRALAEEGILHYQPRQMAEGSTFMRIVNENRARGGFPSEDAAVTPLAKLWERYADYAVSPMQAGSRLSKNKQDLSNYRNTQPIEKENPWLLKVPPETQVYDLTNYGDAYGFPHLVDELKAAVSPTSELPANLRLTVEQLDKVTMPQAVKRVAEINAWRAKQAAEAEKQGLMTNLQATPRLKDESMQLSFVEKPGATWVDVPETVTEDGVKLCTSLGKAGGWCTQNEGSARSYGSGSNRLTTMIDAEGRPHAQAKITTPIENKLLNKLDELSLQTKGEIYSAAEANDPLKKDWKIYRSGRSGEEFDRRRDLAVQEMLKRFPEFAELKTPVDITELKPPGNSFTSERSTEYLRRDPDYKAKVADSVLKFLNSGTWGKVNDLQHYDIADLKDSNSITNAINNLYPGDFQKGADAFNMAADMEPNTPRFMSQRQLREFIEPSTKPEGFAKGGLVEYDPDHIESLAKSFDAEEFASGGAVRMGLGGFFKMVKSATGKAAKTAKAVEPEIDAGRRSFGKSLLNPTQSAENLPAATPTSIANIPMSRRTFLRAAASPVVQSTLGSLSPALASQAPSVSSIVKQATAPVAASLSTPVKAGALNLLKQAHDLNVRHPLDFRDRAAVVRELAQYEGQPLVGEGGLSLKEFMRQLKADPKVYETLMKDLDYLGASVRHSYALPSKEAYLSYEPMSAATTAREARIWDKYEGRFKEPRVRGGEDSPPRMFDPNLSEFYYDYGDVDPAILPQLNKAMEGLPHDEARKIYKKAATEYQKLEKADKSKFYREAAKENSPFGKVLSTKDLYKREDTPASTMLSAFMLNDDKWFTLPTQDEFLNILRSKGLLPEGTQMDPEQLSSIYNNALGEAKSIVQSIPYDPRHEHVDKYYKGFGIDIPEYVPLSKRNPPPAEAEFASGGAVNYNQSHIDELAAQFHKEM